MKNNKGFTLIELLASLTLIAILAVIIIPMSLNLVNKSNAEQCNRVVDTILSEAELCYLDKNDICYVENGTKKVTLQDLYINGYIEDSYESQSTGMILAQDNNDEFTNFNRFSSYIITIDVSKGYPEYSFDSIQEFCGE